MTKLRRVTPDGVTDYLPLLTAKINNSFDKQQNAQIRTTQPLQDVDGNDIRQLAESDDEIYVSQDGSDIFGGVLRDVKRVGAEIDLVVDSFERYARDAYPTGPSSKETKDDDQFIKDAIANSPEVTEGTIEHIRPNLTFTFHYATPALKMKLVRDTTDGETLFHPDKTVDYVDELGSDKTGTTISPANQHFVNDMKVDRAAGQVLANHLKVVGADGTSVDVGASSYDPNTDREKWRRAYFKDTSDPSTLRRRGKTLLKYVTVPWIKIECTITDPPNQDITPKLGDRYHVEVPTKDVDDDFRITEYTRKINNEGEFFEVTFSNRTKQLGDVLGRSARYQRDPSGSSVGGARVPGINIPTTHVPPNKYLQQEYILPASTRMDVLMVQQQPGAGLAAEVILESSGEKYSQTESAYETGDPLFSIQTGDDADIVYFRLDNPQDDTIAGGALFSFNLVDI